ncbi:MAG: anthranilate phosphoribosyltransferase [Deinococcales bacterium]
MSNALFAKAVSSQSLSLDEAQTLMGLIMDGELSSVKTAAVLAALRVRGETVAEISGFAKAMRARAVRVPVQAQTLVDTCGTGGNGTQTFNISTASAFVVAAAGIKVAKHGNRTGSRQSGSADLLEALGVRLEFRPEQVLECIEQIGIGFLFARSHHPAMRHAAPVRAELGLPTVFNVLGPLTNPAGATHQLLGVANKHLVPLMAGVLQQLEVRGALVVHGLAPDGTRYDDISVAGKTHVAQMQGAQIKEYELLPEDLGLETHPSEALLGADSAHNAQIVRAVLGGAGSAAQRDAVAANAGAALFIAEGAETLQTGVKKALEILESGAALGKLEQFIRFSQR